VPEDRTTERPRQETRREGTKGGDRPNGGIELWEEELVED
jgi:hypothetical protein